MKVSFLAATSISLAALVSSCGSSSPKSSSPLQASSNSSMSGWVDVTTTDGTTPSTCEKTPDNCTKKEIQSALWWSRQLPEKLAWQKAIDACAALTHNGQKAGTWHLPSKEQLVAAMNNGILGARSADWISWKDMRSDNHWSASSYSDFPNSAWHVYLGYGYTHVNSKDTDYAVVCVQ